MTLNGFQLHQQVKDLEGTVINEQIMPTATELEEARKAGKTTLQVKEKPRTIFSTIKTVLLTDLQQRTAQGIIPDPHEEKKYEFYDFIRNMQGVGTSEAEFTIESEMITIIKERMRKLFSAEIYGFICDVLSGKNKDFAVVKKEAAPEA